MTAPFRLTGRTAIVTGGASGIGEATCRVLTGAGASVIISDLAYSYETGAGTDFIVLTR